MLVALACAPRAPSSLAPTEQTVLFVKTPPRVGRVAVEENTTEFRLRGEAVAENGGSVRIATETIERERKREEVIAVFERIVTKKKVTYEQLERREIRDGSPVALPPNPLAGHAYIAEVKNSVLVVTDAKGNAVSDAESKELAHRLSGLGKPDPFLEGIPDGVLRPDQSAPGMTNGFLEMFEGGDEGPDIGKVDIRFSGAKNQPQGRCGVFTFAIEVQMAGEPRLRMDLKGEFLVRVSDSAPIALDVRGPARLSGRQTIEGVNVRLDGTGEMQGSFRVTYL
jgi:hypothetical protein